MSIDKTIIDQANEGDIDAIHLLGHHISQSNKDLAIKWLTISANNDHYDSHKLLGDLYCNHNQEKALYHYLECAKLIASFYINIGNMFEHGTNGFEKDETKALKYYTKASKHGVIGSHIILANIYAKYPNLAHLSVYNYSIAAHYEDKKSMEIMEKIQMVINPPKALSRGWFYFW